MRSGSVAAPVAEGGTDGGKQTIAAMHRMKKPADRRIWQQPPSTKQETLWTPEPVREKAINNIKGQAAATF